MLAFGSGTVFLLSTLFFAAVAVVLAYRNICSREDRKQRGILRSWPIRQCAIENFAPCFQTGIFGPDRKTEIRFIPCYKVEGGISDLETWVICNLAKNARAIFEFGTCTGKTTYLLAANAPPDATITTLTLDPASCATYRMDSADQDDAKTSAMNESGFTSFLYSGTPEEKKIVQLFGDSKSFDESSWRDSCDLVFVDGSHARSYVESDSRKALNIIKPNGIILWHDYRGPRHTQGVFEALNELGKRLKLVHIAGTSFVAYQRPQPDSGAAS